MSNYPEIVIESGETPLPENEIITQQNAQLFPKSKDEFSFTLKDKLLFNFNLLYKTININFSLIDIDKNAIKISSKVQDDKILKSYETFLKFNELKKKI